MAIFALKVIFFKQYPLNEKLFWGEGEDVEWSLRVREVTRFKMNQKSSVRYLKLKDVCEAPNCKNWIENTDKMRKLCAQITEQDIDKNKKSM